MSRGERDTAAQAAPAQAQAPTGISTKRDRIVALLAARGVVPDFDAPMPTEVRHQGSQIGRVVGRDADPELEYVRVSANNAASIGRYLGRGYRLVDPSKDVRLEACEGSDDLMMAAPKQYVEERRRQLREAKRARRARPKDTGAQGAASYTADEGRWVRPDAPS